MEISPWSLVARRILFSSAHRYEQPQFSDAQNREIFGRCFTPYGHGHNYILEPHIVGPIDPVTGLVVNLTDVDELLTAVIQPLDHQHLNFDVPYFRDKVPTTEEIAAYCFQEVRAQMRQSVLFQGLQLVKVRLFETDDLWAEYGPWAVPAPSPQLQISRRYTLRALHNLENPDIGNEENTRLYGPCYRLHGHDYQFTVTVTAPLDAHDGLALDRDQLDALVHERWLRRYDGHNLNEHFKNTACEALVREIFRDLAQELQRRPNLGSLCSVSCQETRKNFFEYNRQILQMEH